MISCLPNRVVIHDARMHADMRHMFLNHQDFAFDDVFDDIADNDAVYNGTVHDLILAAVESGVGAVLMYGQTGSGKTFTKVPSTNVPLSTCSPIRVTVLLLPVSLSCLAISSST